MKKLTILLAAVAVMFSAHAQQWVSFSGSKPGAPEINLLTNSAQSVSFELTIPGIYTTDTVVDGMSFTRLMLQGGGAVNPAGFPELPTLVCKVAIPECEETEIDFSISSTQNLPDGWVYPVPNWTLKDSTGFEVIEEFAFNPNAYQQPCTPEPVAVVVSDGAFRAQKYVEIIVQPVEFCPVTKQIFVIEKVEITLNFTKPNGELRQNVGIFNKIAAQTFINYEDDGIGAIINDKAFEKQGFLPGTTRWISLEDTAQACQIIADYLIITESKFFYSPPIKELATHRAIYNGFDVAIVKVEDILARDFYYEGQDENDTIYRKEQKMRTFIRRVYEGENAPNTGDGRLAYLLLVGDNYVDEHGNKNMGMPTSFNHDAEEIYAPFETFPSDYYFGCFWKNPATGKYTDHCSLYIGRFSVEDEEQLGNVVRKTINHETEYSPQAWRKTAGATTIIDPVPLQLTETLLSNLFDSRGWNYSLVGSSSSSFNFMTPTLNYLNTGVAFVQYQGAGFTSQWGYNSQGFNIPYLSTALQNDYKAPFIHAVAGNTGRFDGNTECLGEFLTRYDPAKGAVGYIGGSRFIDFWYNTVNTGEMQYQHLVPHYLFNPIFSSLISTAGEVMLMAKRLAPSNLGIQIALLKTQRYGMNLFGDPALNIMAEGYEITRSVTAECPVEIPCKVTVRNNATLTVPAGCALHFLQKGQLIVESNGNLIIEDGAQIIGINNQIDTTIHVMGGGFTAGSNVTFQNLPGGVVLENEAYVMPWYYDATRQYNLNHATFTNTPLTHRGSWLNISNCTFDSGSNVKTYVSRASIDSCTFNESTFFSDQTNMTGNLTPSTTVRNSSFTGNNSNTIALYLKNTEMFNIFNNKITKYNKGIVLHECGLTLGAPNQRRGSVVLNKISSCGTGIEMYNSVACIDLNNIYKSTYGVRLFNNSYTVFGYQNQPTVHPQTIQDCKSIEFYADANSFPVYFHYNIIIDEENLGIAENDPLVWWDVVSRVIPQNVKYNCWGENFDPTEDLYPHVGFIYYDSIWCPGIILVSPSQGAAEILYETGLDYFAEEDYLNAELTFKELITTYPESNFAIAAMHELLALTHFTDSDFATLQNYFASFTPNDSNLFNTADFLSTRCHVKDKNWQPAIDWYEYRIENPPSYQDSIFAVIDLGDIHLMIAAEEAAAAADTTTGAKAVIAYHYRLSEIKPVSIQAYEENKATLLATLPQIKKSQTETPPPAPATGGDVEKLKGKQGVLGQNIPNPATGITTIGYELYTEGAVEIKIYNISGQLLQALPQGTLGQGTHQAKVSLSSLSAGMYHYALFVNGERVDTKKMVVN